MVHDQISILFLEKSYDHIFNVRKECLIFSLRKYQENCVNLEI